MIRVLKYPKLGLSVGYPNVKSSERRPPLFRTILRGKTHGFGFRNGISRLAQLNFVETQYQPLGQFDAIEFKENLDWAYDKLNRTSRSFAAVIPELPKDLRHVVALFYLVLRALDSIEDDMKVDTRRKGFELANFYTHLTETNWSLTGFGDTQEEMELLTQFQKITKCLENLEPKYLQIITSICQKMGKGMGIFLNRRIESYLDWEVYCHYVAGLVGHGLSAIWAASGLEAQNFVSETTKVKSSSFGIFLQKTNIVRDIREDTLSGRLFWPKTVWADSVSNQSDMLKKEYEAEALKCLNWLVTDAFGHVEDCIDYLEQIRNPGIFRFCAVPQIMASATLSLCYGNYAVFKENVKIPRVEAAMILRTTSSLTGVLKYTAAHCQNILNKIEANEPQAEFTHQRFQGLLDRCKRHIRSGTLYS